MVRYVYFIVAALWLGGSSAGAQASHRGAAPIVASNTTPKPAFAQQELKKLPQTPGALGDQQRHYFFADAKVESPYRLYVPRKWTAESNLPLVIILHGHGGHHDDPFDGTPLGSEGIVQAQAEAHGFIVVSPEGFGKADFGNELPLPFKQEFQGDPPDPANAASARRDNAYAEKDALNVIAIVAKEYRIDRTRVFLMGNSGGSMGTLSLAAKYPEMWAAISPSDGPVEPTLYHAERLKGLRGARVIHAENDKRASMDAMREIAEKIKAAGVPTEFRIAPGAVHATGWYVELSGTFDYFASRPPR